MPFSTVLPAIIFPAALILTAAVYAYVLYERRMANSLWVVEVHLHTLVILPQAVLYMLESRYDVSISVFANGDEMDSGIAGGSGMLVLLSDVAAFCPKDRIQVQI